MDNAYYQLDNGELLYTLTQAAISIKNYSLRPPRTFFQGSIRDASKALEAIDLEHFRSFNSALEYNLLVEDVRETILLLKKFKRPDNGNRASSDELTNLLWHLCSLTTAFEHEDFRISYDRCRKEAEKHVLGEMNYLRIMAGLESIKSNADNNNSKKGNNRRRQKGKK